MSKTLAPKQLDDELFVKPLEMQDILSNEELLRCLKNGHIQAKEFKGHFIE